MDDLSDEQREQLRESLELSWGVWQATCAYTLTIGLDVRPGMEAVMRLLMDLDGETTDAEQNLKDFETKEEVEEKLKKLPKFPPDWTLQEREGWKLLGDALLTDETVGIWDEWLENLPRPRLTKSLPQLRARMEKLTAEAKPSEDGSTEWFLPVRVELADCERRRSFQTLTVVFYWEQASHNEWHDLSSHMRDNLLELLNRFNEQGRQKVLEGLPIADRRRLEAMKQWTPEEWEQAGVIEP